MGSNPTSTALNLRKREGWPSRAAGPFCPLVSVLVHAASAFSPLTCGYPVAFAGDKGRRRFPCFVWDRVAPLYGPWLASALTLTPW